ncbi:hypothetical protein ACFQJ7_01580 [Halovenus rubra]|uniref:Uncharacterized protein n=2 Tax=Halovenus rubra TaxID=869890 RepID=A0ABD5X2I6_9EURY|nr:hypothetical protein [Halovenus rubra]
MIHSEARYFTARRAIDADLDDVREQAARFFATQGANGVDIEDQEVTFVTRSEEVATTLNEHIDED